MHCRLVVGLVRGVNDTTPSKISSRRHCRAASIDDAGIVKSPRRRTPASALPPSRYAHGPAKPNGLLLGLAALTERRIVAGVATLAAVLRGQPSVRTKS